MSLRSDLEAFLRADLFTLVGTAFKVDDGDIYFERDTRHERSGTEILLTWGQRERDNQQLGDYLYTEINIELFVATVDGYEIPSRRIEEKIEATATLIRDTYDGNIYRFASTPFGGGSLDYDIDAVRCRERGPIESYAADAGNEPRRVYTMDLALEMWARENIA